MDFARDALVLQVESPTSDDAAVQLTRRVEEVLAEFALKRPLLQTSGVGLKEGARALRPHGLFRIGLVDGLDPVDLRAVAMALKSLPEVKQVHPQLKRSTGRAFTDDRLIVKARPGKLDALLQDLSGRLGTKLIRTSRLKDTALVQVGPQFGHDAIFASAWLFQNKPADLVLAEPDLYRELAPRALTDDPMIADQWHLTRSNSDVPGQGQIFAAEAWNITMGNPAVVVSVFDTGTDVDHPDLAPNVVGGFDASSNDDDPRPECSDSYDGRDYADSCPDSRPFRESHGTSVSGTIAARGDNGIGVAGVCPMCSLLPVRLLGASSASSLTNAEAFVRAVDEGAWVINNSWGPGLSLYFPLSAAEREAFIHARLEGRDGLGTVILFAAGNDSSDVAADAYARDPEVIAVSASTNLDDWAIYSNWGNEIDVAAPSQGGAIDADSHGIVTTDVTGDDGYSATDYNRGFGGTSAASPVAAGVAGLILSANPHLTADQVRVILTNTADKIRADQVDWVGVAGQDLEAALEYDATGHSLGFGWGRVNAHEAVLSALEPLAQGGLCSDPECALCGTDGRCELICDKQEECPQGTVCSFGSCSAPRPAPTEVGQPCGADCEACTPAVDTEFVATDVCTGGCGVDGDCPLGFDCRLLDGAGNRMCVVGSESAGEPDDFFNCWDPTYGISIVVEGDDGQGYCTDSCDSELGASACPHGFHCGYADCTCTAGNGNWCWEYTCGEAASAQASNWYFPVCFANEGFGVGCESDFDCALGSYCTSDGTCRMDDREGCTVCNACTSDDECGSRGLCAQGEDEEFGECVQACGPNGKCPGDSVCRTVEGRRGQTFELCLSPEESGVEDRYCAADYTCEVPCREDLPCWVDEDESSADDGLNKQDEKAGFAALGCSSSSNAPAGWAVLTLFFAALLRRRRLRA
jgi:uncharacterized protein (TIGR03382 family)